MTYTQMIQAVKGLTEDATCLVCKDKTTVPCPSHTLEWDPRFGMICKTCDGFEDTPERITCPCQDPDHTGC